MPINRCPLSCVSIGHHKIKTQDEEHDHASVSASASSADGAGAGTEKVIIGVIVNASGFNSNTDT